MTRVAFRRLLTLMPLCLVVAAPGIASAFYVAPAKEGDTAGQSLIVNREMVVLTMVGSSAAWNNAMAWGGDAQGSFLCHDVPPGFTTVVGRFRRPTDLLLTLTTPEGDVWTAGPGERNRDGAAHARLTATGPNTVRVEWEDQPGGGDSDYNDCVVDLSITPAR